MCIIPALSVYQRLKKKKSLVFWARVMKLLIKPNLEAWTIKGSSNHTAQRKPKCEVSLQLNKKSPIK